MSEGLGVGLSELAWMLPLALIVILSTLHSPGSSGWPGCVL